MLGDADATAPELEVDAVPVIDDPIDKIKKNC